MVWVWVLETIDNGRDQMERSRDYCPIPHLSHLVQMKRCLGIPMSRHPSSYRWGLFQTFGEQRLGHTSQTI